jgi:hypothetical protein
MKAIPVEKGFVVIIDKDEEIISTLTSFFSDHDVYSGTIQGIGAVKDVELGFFNVDQKTYERETLAGPFELLSLNGNITRLDDGSTFVHCHVVLSDSEHRAIGGHLFKGFIAVTAELFVRVFSQEIYRRFDTTTGLKLISGSVR